MNYKIPVLLGTTRKGNQSQKVARTLQQYVAKLPNVDTQLLDLSETNFPIMEERIGVWENPPPILLEWVEILKTSNALLIVAPEYKNGYPGALKNLMDFMPPGILKYKPVGICTVSSGQFGGTNCLALLRLLCLSLGGMPMPDRLQVAYVEQLFDEEEHLKDEKLIRKSKEFVKELLKYAVAFKQL